MWGPSPDRHVPRVRLMAVASHSDGSGFSRSAWWSGAFPGAVKLFGATTDDYYRKGYGPGPPEHTILLLMIVPLVVTVCLLACRQPSGRLPSDRHLRRVALASVLRTPAADAARALLNILPV